MMINIVSEGESVSTPNYVVLLWRRRYDTRPPRIHLTAVSCLSGDVCSGCGVLCFRAESRLFQNKVVIAFMYLACMVHTTTANFVSILLVGLFLEAVDPGIRDILRTSSQAEHEGNQNVAVWTCSIDG